MVASVRLAGRLVGPGRPCFIIAEAGVNHNGSIARALALVDAAAESGADAVKFQTFSAARLASPDAPKAAYQKKAGRAGETQREMLEKLELTEADHRILSARCRRRGIVFLSSPFDEESLDLLVRVGVPAIKLPSGELTNHPFLRRAAATGKPLILSTGMATMGEVSQAVRALGTARRRLVLLHCVSAYPAKPAWANLRAMSSLEKAFRVPVGWSDHTLGDEVSFAAAALGARVIEKHLTLDRRLPGPDHAASLEPGEFAALARGVRAVESALGDGVKRPVPAEREIAAVARKSVVAARPIPSGARLTAAMLRASRPSGGIPPSRTGELVGRVTARAIPEGVALAWSFLR
jgi:N,N'-diacetyllegionaminate synthase